MIDLRSDTVTRPTEAVRRAMAAAEVGDDVYREDPEVEALQEEVADRFGRDAALFVPSGVMGTLVLLRALVEPGAEVVCESDAHVVAYEAGAGALHAGVQFRTIDGERGRLDVDLVRPRLRPPTFPYTAVGAISVEETTNRGGGAIHGLERLRALRALADERGVPLHGDGARLFNAIVAAGTDPREYGEVFTAFSFCLSKGLGAPVGSLVVGDADVIDAARAWRRRFGGAMRQVGVLAAAGRHVLAHHVERLADDHANARTIAATLADAVPGSCDPDEVETNIVYVDTASRPAAEVLARLRDAGVLAGAMGEHLVRLVTHLDVSADDAERAAVLLATVLTDK
ncbi:threonine aldolase family protein [Egicoccus halophilus]|uniref:Threonine aldolase n=1 Tax=Egicoccus halophilus TaxID=1670830 RepID=A0A8J3ACE5_9ACTN|nr:GntG family PLP-dependent aldolase [Egicoccus halophilus]GGI04987.1 threonine aldolase [Egicoccus halophilus]